MFDEISRWLDTILQQEMPENMAAFCVNLYEDEGNTWSLELVATSRFDVGDEDWACDEVTDFGTREHPFAWKQEATWEVILEKTSACLKRYLDNGKCAPVLKESLGVAAGFVDGNLEIIYVRR